MAKKVTTKKTETPAIEDLIAMSKANQTIKVCKAQVEQHKRLGWNLVEK